MAYAERTDALERLVGGDTDKVTDALEAGAADIDSAFSAGGYASPVDLSSLSEPALTRWTAKLRWVNLALAARALSTGAGDRSGRGQTSQVRKDYDDAKDWLKMVAEGKVAMPVALASSKSGITVAGDPSFDVEAVEAAQEARQSGVFLGTGSDERVTI